MAALGSFWPLFLVGLVSRLCWTRSCVAATSFGLARPHASRIAQYSFVASSPLLRCGRNEGPTGPLLPRTVHRTFRSSSFEARVAARGATPNGSQPLPPASYYAPSPHGARQTRTHGGATAEEEPAAALRWKSLGHCGTGLAADSAGPWHLFHERRLAAFRGISAPSSYGGTQGDCARLNGRPGWFCRSSPRLVDAPTCRRKAGDNGGDGPALGREPQHYPQDLEAFRQAILRLDSRFLQIAKETASPTAKNEEILQSLGMLWRQRRLEQRQEEQERHSLDGKNDAPLYGSADEAVVGRKSGSAFRARAYKTAYEILHRSRIPIYNIAEVLLLLREGGLLLRGEENNMVKSGAFRSAVLQKINLVVSHGLAQLIKKSRSVMREGALQDLSRLPGVTKRTAAALFDEHFIDSAQALRDRLAALQYTVTQGPRASPDRWPSPVARLGNDAESSAFSPTSDSITLTKLFPTYLSRACVIHADSFGAAMDTAEFDEWQQQLLLVQQNLRELEHLAPPLPLGGSDGQQHGAYASQDFSSRTHALPVVSLGGGIFHAISNKLISLTLQISLLPSWTEEGLLPLAIDQAVCCGGQGAGPEEISWVKRQWDQALQAYRALRQELQSRVVDALKQRNLLTEVICDNSGTRTTHAAGRLPWRQETYRLISIRTVPPRAFPFATLAARCSTSAYRLLQDRTRKRWGWSLTPSGLTAPSNKKARIVNPAKIAASTSPGQTTAVIAGEADAVGSPDPEGGAPASTLADQALWVFDEQGVLRLLQEPLSMQERIGNGPIRK